MKTKYMYVKLYKYPVERYVLENNDFDSSVAFKRFYTIDEICQEKKFVSVDEFIENYSNKKFTDKFINKIYFEAYLCGNGKFFGTNLRYFDETLIRNAIKYDKLTNKKKLGKDIKVMVIEYDKIEDFE